MKVQSQLCIVVLLFISFVCSNEYYRDEKYEQSKAQKKLLRNETIENYSVRDNQSEPLYVHIVPHTHDDVGWIKTVDEYFTGSNEASQPAEVNLILSGTIQALQNNKERKFTYCEIKFFTMWYDVQTQDVKDQLKQLIKEGRFEFVNGGWSMFDEAAPHYEDMINDMMKGHEFLLSEFGVKPRMGWQLDPFGHSSATPRLFADMGFEAWMFARLDWADKDKRTAERSMNLLWRPFSKHFGNQKQILTGIMKNHYCWPDGYWYDTRWYGDDPFVSNKNYSTFNADQKTKDFIQYVIEYASSYRGNNILLPFGCDFTNANARMNFENTDRLIEYFNAHNNLNIKLLYSTPAQYLDSLYKENNTWPVNYYDMMPYGDNPQDYWSGYFASRQGAKKQVRDGQANLLASNQLYSLKAVDQNSNDSDLNEMIEAKESMLDSIGVYQHHDGISGTAKQRVADDYKMRLLESTKLSNKKYTEILINDMKKNTGIEAESLEYCIGAQNDTVFDCPISQHADQQESIVVIHNPASQTFTQLIRIQLPHSNYQAQVWCPFSQKFYPKQVDIVPQNRRFNNGTSSVDYDMYLPYKLYPNQIGYIKLTQNQTSDDQKVFEHNFKQQVENATLSLLTSEKYPVEFELKVDYSEENSFVQKFGLSLGYYAASQGKDDYKDSNNDPEGAYLFKPDRWQRNQIPFGQEQFKQLSHFQNGNYLEQWEFEFKKNCESDDNQTYVCQYALMKVQFSPYFNNLVVVNVELNSIGVKDGQGKDVIVNWHFDDFQANKTFWTDSNGLEMQERILNYRFTYKFETDQNISANYYPIDTAVALRDFQKNRQATVMTERSTAGSAELIPGTIEIIQNRRLVYDDNRGVSEPLNETDSQGFGMKFNSKYYLDIFDRTYGKSKQRSQQLFIDQPIQLFFAFNYSQNQVQTQTQDLLKLLKVDQFENGKILAFPMGRDKVMFRVENIADRFDYEFEKPQNLELNLQEYAMNFYKFANGISSADNDIDIEIKEYDISNNMDIKESEDGRRKWKGDDDEIINAKLEQDECLKSIYTKPEDKNGMSGIVLEPQRIRTFQVQYKTSQSKFLQ